MQANAESSFGGRGSDGRSLVVDRHGAHIVVLLFALGTLLQLPAVTTPLLLDDYLQSSMLAGRFPTSRSPFDLYNFINDADRTILVQRGTLPWWSAPTLTIRFLRPLSSGLLWVDHRLFGNAALPLHVHSLIWWIAAVLAARALFARLFRPRPALMATAIFALAPCHTIPLAWLANREALVSFTFGTLGLSWYLRWRDGRAVRDAALAAAAFALALLGGEYALCFAGYVLAIEIVTRGERLSSRLGGLLPFAIPAGAYFAAHVAGGYGTSGSGFYTDPLHDPRTFLAIAPMRAAALLSGGWLALDNETLTGSTPKWVPVLLVVAIVALLYAPVRRTFARLEEPERRTAGWMLIGSVLAIAPVLAVLPSPRLLGASVLGIAPVVALILDDAWFPRALVNEDGARGRFAKLTGYAALALGFAHFVHGPVSAFLIGRQTRKIAVDFRDGATALAARIAETHVSEVIVVRSLAGAFFLPFAIHTDPPIRWRILAHTGHVLALGRDARTVDLLVPPDQVVFGSGEANLFRDQHSQPHVGDEFDAPGLHAQILEVSAIGPRRLRYRLEGDLEAPSRLWINEASTGYETVTPPKPGFGTPFDP